MHSKSICFSPTHSTERVVKYVEEGLGLENECFDIAYRKNKDLNLSLNKDDLLIVGMPVFEGSIPKLAIERFSNIKGDNTPAIILITYGNINYKESLIELQSLVESQGFKPIAAATIVTEHSVFPQLGEGRPDMKDFEQIDGFIDDVKTKLANDISNLPKLSLHKDKSKCKAEEITLAPKLNSRLCVSCMVCYKGCPVNIISSDDLKIIDESKCINCMRCVFDCPEGARSLPMLKSFFAERTIDDNCKVRKEPEFIL